MGKFQEAVQNMIDNQRALDDARIISAARLLSLVVGTGLVIDWRAWNETAEELAQVADTYNLIPDDIQGLLVLHEPVLGAA